MAAAANKKEPVPLSLIKEVNNLGMLWVNFGMEQFVRRMWEHFTIKKSVGQISVGIFGEIKARMEMMRLAAGVAVHRGAGACHNRDLRFESLFLRHAYYECQVIGKAI